MNKKVILMILDGWGISTDPEKSAIEKANTPFIEALYKKYPNSRLQASGVHVGLPDGQMGNSEVGHMNIGAGRVVYQDLLKINKAIEEKTVYHNQTLLDAFKYAKENDKKVHFIGLISDGGIHSHIKHLKGLCEMAEKESIKDYFIHGFTDGRDTDPKSGKDFVNDLENFLSDKKGELASIVGRYYAMDRDKRWERIKIAYDLLVNGSGTNTRDLQSTIIASYQANITDEFIKPIIKVDNNNRPIATVQEGDVVISFNFRTDRGRQITQVLTQEYLEEGDSYGYDMKKLPLYFVTLTNYDDTFKDIKVIFSKENLKNTLGEVLSKNDKKQIRIAETEKYPHVTFFFSGGREEPFNGEKRILCPSPKVATYDLKPEMSANDIKEKINVALDSQKPDFVCLNFANPDMVGHTGIFEAAVKACETVDKCTQSVVETALDNSYTCIIIADHGNCDYMINEDGTPNTAHTTNLVPCILVDKDYKGEISDGKLGDLAPTILKLMGINIPKEMTGEVLI